jgi:hypothetical protein
VLDICGRLSLNLHSTFGALDRRQSEKTSFSLGKWRARGDSNSRPSGS